MSYYYPDYYELKDMIRELNEGDTDSNLIQAKTVQLVDKILSNISDVPMPTRRNVHEKFKVLREMLRAVTKPEDVLGIVAEGYRNALSFIAKAESAGKKPPYKLISNQLNELYKAASKRLVYMKAGGGITRLLNSLRLGVNIGPWGANIGLGFAMTPPVGASGGIPLLSHQKARWNAEKERYLRELRAMGKEKTTSGTATTPQKEQQPDEKPQKDDKKKKQTDKKKEKEKK